MMTRFEQDCMQVQTESLRKLAGIMAEVMKDLGRIANSLETLLKLAIQKVEKGN